MTTMSGYDLLQSALTYHNNNNNRLSALRRKKQRLGHDDVILYGEGRGPSRSVIYPRIANHDLVLRAADRQPEPQLNKFYLDTHLNFLPAQLRRDLVQQRISSRRATILKYLKTTYNYYPAYIYQRVMGRRYDRNARRLAR